jgi:hypothetical protein
MLVSKDPKEGRKVKLYIHLIPELMVDEEFRKTIALIEERNEEYTHGFTWNDPLIHVTLLGLKNIGRATNIPRDPKPEIIDVITRTSFTPIGIDTKFANDYQVFLDNQGIDRKLYTTEEGKFSMYVDMLKMEAYKSSYELDKPISILSGSKSIKNSYQIFKEMKTMEE